MHKILFRICGLFRAYSWTTKWLETVHYGLSSLNLYRKLWNQDGKCARLILSHLNLHSVFIMVKDLTQSVP